MNFFKSYGSSMKVVTGIVALLVCGWSAYAWFSYDNGIVNYVADRDKVAIKKMFHDDWQFLYFGDWDKITEDDFDIDFMLDNRSSSQHSATGNLVLKVLRENGKTVGFLAYWPKSPYWWHMLFLIVDVDHRRSGNASKLVQYFIDDAVARGALKVTTFTRLANVRARGLYEGKFHFKNMGDPYKGTDYENKYLDLALYPKNKK
ncbi:GNAT family N-acetyltransferase [Candidatus Babeliales bacterium]|nr:GNAT family N-acetyltransferase [Candidatus Babeliales bacterium]MBP9844080.1 GNAT family N-acetyltransferase [Candidatus Babeliales bacterium]